MNIPTAKELNPLTASRSRKFVLQRNEDETGISGTGVIAEGIEFSTGWCALSWMTAAHSVGIYLNIKELERIHGHNGRAVIVWEAAQPQPGRVEGMGDGLQGHAGTIVGWLRDGVFIGADADDNVSSYMDRGWQAVAVVPPSTVFALPELATPTAGGDA